MNEAWNRHKHIIKTDTWVQDKHCGLIVSYLLTGKADIKDINYEYTTWLTDTAKHSKLAANANTGDPVLVFRNPQCNRYSVTCALSKGMISMPFIPGDLSTGGLRIEIYTPHHLEG